MKKIITTALLACNLCFAFDSDWEAQARYEDVDFYVTLIYDQNVNNKAKISYLLMLSKIYAENQQYERAEDAIKWIRFLLWIDPTLTGTLDFWQD